MVIDVADKFKVAGTAVTNEKGEIDGIEIPGFGSAGGGSLEVLLPGPVVIVTIADNPTAVRKPPGQPEDELAD